jgi:hypothetical protein
MKSGDTIFIKMTKQELKAREIEAKLKKIQYARDFDRRAGKELEKTKDGQGQSQPQRGE